MRHSCPAPPAGPADAAAGSHQERPRAVALQCMHAQVSGRCARDGLADPGAIGCRYCLSQRGSADQIDGQSGNVRSKGRAFGRRAAERLQDQALVSEICCKSPTGAARLAAASRCMQHFSSISIGLKL
jgi:hypothetical protein